MEHSSEKLDVLSVRMITNEHSLTFVLFRTDLWFEWKKKEFHSKESFSYNTYIR